MVPELGVLASTPWAGHRPGRQRLRLGFWPTSRSVDVSHLRGHSPTDDALVTAGDFSCSDLPEWRGTRHAGRMYNAPTSTNAPQAARRRRSSTDRHLAGRGTELGFRSLKAYLADRAVTRRWPSTSIADELGVHPSTVRDRLDQQDLPRLRAGRTAPPGDPTPNRLLAAKRHARLVELGFADMDGTCGCGGSRRAGRCGASSPSGRDKTWTTAAGKVLTEADAARLAEEFERDDAALDTGTVTFPRKAGRPSLTGRAAVSPKVTLRVTPELRDQAERLAGERGTTVSRLAREALEQLLHSSTTGGELDQELLDHLIVEFLDHGQRAVDFLRSAAGLLSTRPELLPQQPALIAYCLREAMKAIPASQDTGGGGQWRTKSREVAEAKQRLEMIRRLPGEDSDGALQELLARIDEMALTHEQDRLHQQRLIAVITNRTGAQPLASGTGPVRTYQDVLDRLDRAVHGAVTLEEARQLWVDCLAILRQLFLPPDTRHHELDALAALDSPSQADVPALLALLAGPNHLRYFLSRIQTPAWLDLLNESEVLQPPAGHAGWPMFAAVEQLRDEHAADLAAALRRMFDRWGSDPQRAWYLARAAVDLDSRGNDLVLRALRQHPTSPGISDLAVWAAEKADPSDEFVQSVADQVLNTTTGARVSAYLEPLLQSLVDGINTDNYASRLRLLCYKLRSVSKDDYGRRYFNSLRRGGSISDRPDPHRHDWFDALLHTLVESLQRVAGRVDLRDLLEAISPLPTDIGDRVRAWLLGDTSPAEPRYLISEVAHAIASRDPTGDDLRLIDRVVAECDPGEYATEWAEAMGVPSASVLGSALAARDVPGEWLRAFEWSGLLPPSVTAAWATAAAIMSGAYGEPSRAALEQRARVESGWGQSPLSESDLAAMTTDDAARWVASWRPDPSQWLVSARELGRTLEAVVKSDPTPWTSSPLKTAGLLRHPTYIHHYLQGLATAAALDKASTDELVDLIVLVRTHPWEAVPLGRDSFDFDPDWRASEEASIDLIKSLADSDIGFGGRRDEVWSILQSEVERRNEPSHIVDGARDPLDAAINRPCTRALQAGLSFMGHEYRTHGTVRPEAMRLLSAVLRLENRDGAEHRAILAPRLGFLRHIASDWVDEHRDELFGMTAPAGLGQLTIDLALRWGQPNSWLLETFPDAVKDAVRRDVDDALAHYLVAMLWQLPQYSVKKVVDFLRSAAKLSAAGEALGHLLRSEDTSPEHARLAVQFWARALDGGTAETLAGFGWLSDTSAIDNDTWTDLTRRTLTATGGRIDGAHKIAERATAQPLSTGTLAILNQLVRGLADEWDQRSVTGLAVQALGQARHLAGTPEYKRLRTTLLERGML